LKERECAKREEREAAKTLLSGGHYIKREEGECVFLGVFFLLIFNLKMYSLSFVPLRGEGWSRNRCVLT
jgi:hypothetical protein